MAQPTKLKLTKRSVEAIAPPDDGEIIVWDSELMGFGVRVAASGRRTYFIYGRTTGGRQVKLKVGVHGAVTADKARENASIELGKLAAGLDPAQERREAKQAERAQLAAPTVTALAGEYLAAHAEVHKRTAADDRATIDKIILPRLGTRKVAEVTHTDLEALHRDMRATPYRANRVLALLSKMFNLAVRWGMRADNPVKGVERYQEHRRERYLRPDEIARLAAVLAGHSNRSSADAVRMLLLTGARRGAVLGATWDQIDFDAGVWTKLGARTKQKTAHRIPLSPAALQLLVEIRNAAEEKAKEARKRAMIAKPSPFIFPGKERDRPLTDIKHFWASVCEDAEIGERIVKRTRDGKVVKNRKGEPVTVWRTTVRLHDLRHTYASLLASAGLSLPIIGQLLGHTQPSTTARYAHLMDNPLRQATTAVAAKLEEFAKAPRKGKLVGVEQ